MTLEQIKAVNDTMSMLADISENASCCISTELFDDYVNKHIQALKDSKVDNLIIEHVTNLCIPFVSYAKRSADRYKEYEEQANQWRELEEIAFKQM